MENLTIEQKKLLNQASEGIRKARKDFYNGNEKISMARKRIEIILDKSMEESQIDKLRRHEDADSDECTEVQKLKDD